MAKEIELKYLMKSAEQEREILNHPLILNQLDGPIEVYNMDSIYYDTRENLLAQNRISLRRRQENNEVVFTVKTSGSVDGALSSRGEWQVEAESLDEALPLLEKLGAPPLLFDILNKNGIVPCARTVFTRKTAPLKLGASLCVDVGMLGAAPFAEIELELSSGSVEDLKTFGAQCCQTFGLKPEAQSKFARARASFNCDN